MSASVIIPIVVVTIAAGIFQSVEFTSNLFNAVLNPVAPVMLTAAFQLVALVTKLVDSTVNIGRVVISTIVVVISTIVPAIIATVVAVPTSTVIDIYNSGLIAIIIVITCCADIVVRPFATTFYALIAKSCTCSGANGSAKKRTFISVTAGGNFGPNDST